MKKILFPIILISSFITAQAPAGYYNGTTGLTGYALKSKLHDIISEKNINWHYDGIQLFYTQTDLDKYYDHDASNTEYLLDIYSEIPSGPDAYEYKVNQLIAGVSGEGQGYNKEHMMPQSTFTTLLVDTGKTISDYPMFSDLNFIIPTDARINQLRRNYPYGIGNNVNHYNFTNGSRISNAAIPNYPYTGRVYEPINEFKGDIARALLYFAVRYEGKFGSFNTAYTTSNSITPATDQCPLDGTEERAIELPYIEMLKQWNAADPVSQREIDRNNAIYSIQNNRNPFIDHPEWVNMIWSETPDNIPPTAPGALTSTQQSAYFINLNWTASPETDVLGYRIYMNGATTPVATTKNTSISIDHLDPSTTYTFTVKAYDKGYLESPVSNTVTASTIASDAYAKDLIITKYISGTNNTTVSNNALEITNKTGHEVNLNNYRINILLKNTQGNYYRADTYELEGKVGNNETFVILNPKATLSCYTNTQAKFVTSSDPMTFRGDNYVELAYNKFVTVDAIGTKYVANTNGNVSLYRKSTINQPNSTFTIGEWDSYPSNYCQNLGTLSTSELITSTDKSLKIYPNPVYDNIFISGETEKIQTAQIIDLSGKVIYTEKEPFRNKKNISVQGIPTGTYLLRLDDRVEQFIKK
ncbi:Por secretion system C-terminal sorting domain-containing protein [Chryseobacterium contaminans]|uniref:Por secretion system C-terminal sorting domain-containing protein n=3 Tax=Chryseobacterium contaminans TaxID=1423959 RepID=A0A1M7CT66_9FLAO|nr:endonuclease [Chryseobacterium contaminans]SHL70434.1 Por secretion system C-terminal sorting domain-containing protein [Chryseobacterium contaminans]